MTGPDQSKSLLRSLGEFVGHIAKGVKTDPAKDQPAAEEQTPRKVEEVSRTTETRTTDDGVILRRTTIEEVEFPARDETDSKP